MKVGVQNRWSRGGIATLDARQMEDSGIKICGDDNKPNGRDIVMGQGVSRREGTQGARSRREQKTGIRTATKLERDQSPNQIRGGWKRADRTAEGAKRTFGKIGGYGGIKPTAEGRENQKGGREGERTNGQSDGKR